MDDSFLHQVRRVLIHVQDWKVLGDSPLAGAFAQGAESSPLSRAMGLRKAVLQAIETLNPGPGVAVRSWEGRAYQILRCRYIQGLSIVQVGELLALSERQVHRELRLAEAAVAEELWTTLHAECKVESPSVPVPANSEAAALKSELTRMGMALDAVDLAEMVGGVLQTVMPLARTRFVRVEHFAPPDLPLVFADGRLLRQALVGMVSHAIQETTSGCVSFEAHETEGEVRLSIGWASDQVSGTGEPRTLIPPAVVEILSSQSLQWRAEEAEGRIRFLCYLRPAPQIKVLVIDDNEAFARLVSRYLQSRQYGVVGDTTGAGGFKKARETKPDVIILDVMMADQDGWETLQALRAQEETRAIPVIVCSVVDDPALALALGAQAFLRKPASLVQLQAALQRCLHSIDR